MTNTAAAKLRNPTGTGLGTPGQKPSACQRALHARKGDLSAADPRRHAQSLKGWRGNLTSNRRKNERLLEEGADMGRKSESLQHALLGRAMKEKENNNTDTLY